MTGNINPNDPRAKRTRKFLQQAFVELLKQKEFESITIQDIANKAEMNRTTFYSHFQDKYEILELTLNTMFSDILSIWIPANSELNEQSLIRNLMLAVCQWQTEAGQGINRKLTISSYIEANTKNQLYTIILSCLEKVIQNNVQKKRQLEIVATMISSSIYGVVLHWNRNGQSERPEELVQYASPIILSILNTIEFDDK
ncbi:DNA-binding transcriptional repressor FabR [compost metagenome]